MNMLKIAVACTLSGVLIASQITPAAAAPLPTNVATMKSVAADYATPVHWRGGWGWGGGWGAGALAGAIIGGAIASSAYGYYGSPYYYGYPYPAYGYYYPRPVYYGYRPYYGYYPRPYRVYRYRHYW